jgi:hypothetical protein
MVSLLRTPWRLFIFSSVIALATGVAIIGFGAPEQTIVPVTYATAAISAVLSDWARRQSRHR